MRRLHLIGILFFLISNIGFAQYEFSGYVDKGIWDGQIYLSVVEDYRKISGIYPEQIIAKVDSDSTGYFSFSGNNLSLKNRIYRIHVDTCQEDNPDVAHYTAYCPNSRTILFIANNSNTLSLPFSIDSEMFCRVLSKNSKANALVKIDSIKSDMRFAFGAYRSEANRKLNTEKWFNILQESGKEIDEPLAELYIYSFLSDRSNDFHSYYLNDLKTNDYYEVLLDRLESQYQGTAYSRQYAGELASDRYLVSPLVDENIPWWMYMLIFVLVISLLANIYYFKKTKNLQQNGNLQDSLSNQEQKVLDLILEDKSNKEIASELFLSVSTVKTHINNLYKKLNVSGREEVIRQFNK